MKKLTLGREKILFWGKKKNGLTDAKHPKDVESFPNLKFNVNWVAKYRSHQREVQLAELGTLQGSRKLGMLKSMGSMIKNQ